MVEENGAAVFHDIAERTGGDIYIGVSGPVRTGKSTFIKRFMDLIVLPNIVDKHELERAKDALPQAGTGKAVMTTEPKFVPDEGVEVEVIENVTLTVRLVDSVGFPVEGATGYEDEDGPRMVVTPWFDYEIPFEEAAEIGTRKVMVDHSTLGLVVTTDGSFGDLGRESFVPAEQRVIAEMKSTGKPFVVLMNSAHPEREDTLKLCDDLKEEHDVSVISVDCALLNEGDIELIMEQLLYEFPVREVQVNLPAWVEELEKDHWFREQLEASIGQTVEQIERLRDIYEAISELRDSDFTEAVTLTDLELGTGVASIDMAAPEEYFYQILGEMNHVELTGKADTIRLMKDLVIAKQEYDRIAGALTDVREVGYGLVIPSVDDVEFEQPELVRRGSQFGIRLQARAPSLHFIRADIYTEITPMVGSERQSEQLVTYLTERFEDDPEAILSTDIFGKPIADLLREGIEDKLYQMPEDAREKLQETLVRILNEGTAGLICIII
ncbi:MAG: stage IV sporulation protein A [Bacillota bacterium]